MYVCTRGLFRKSVFIHAKCARGTRLCSDMGIARVLCNRTAKVWLGMLSKKLANKETKHLKLKPDLVMAYTYFSKSKETREMPLHIFNPSYL